ncbi:MAG TPA: PAS domain-containing protein [Sphingomonadaceae bacterium]|nr:PAS domain-containing protein [Sphingomonadaceae bacterium]
MTEAANIFLRQEYPFVDRRASGHAAPKEAPRDARDEGDSFFAALDALGKALDAERIWIGSAEAGLPDDGIIACWTKSARDALAASFLSSLLALPEERYAGGPRWLVDAGDGERAVHVTPLTARTGPAWMAIGFAGMPDAEVRDRVKRTAAVVAPLLTSYIDARSEGHRSRLHIAGLASALDQSSMATIVLDSDGRTQFLNRAARTLLNAEDGLRRRDDSVIPVQLQDALKFQLALDHAIHQNRAARRIGLPKGSMLMIQSPEKRRPLVVTMIPVEEPALERGEAAVILYMVRPPQDVSPFLDPLCKLHGLSNSEARLAEKLVAGKTICEAASAMRIKSATARAYLKQIFLKTDTHRQTELVRLLIRSSAAVTVSAPPEPL